MVYVAICIPHQGFVSMEWASRVFTELQKPPDTVFYFRRGIPRIDTERNALVNDALKDGAEWVFFLDSDVIPPPNALVHMLSMEYPLVTGVYTTKLNTFAVYNFDENGDIVPVQEIKSNSIVDAAGLGCCLIHRKVFEDLKRDGFYPWFKYELDPYDAPKGKGEDIYFFWQVKQHGKYKLLVDAFVRCEHEAYLKIFQPGQVKVPKI